MVKPCYGDVGFLQYKVNQQKHLTAYQKHAIAYSIDNASKAFGLDPFLIMALVQAESGFVVKAQSDKQCQGLMQLYNGSALKLLKMLGLHPKMDWKAIDNNILLGTYFVSLLFEEFLTERLALIGYNAGPVKLKGYLQDKHVPNSIEGFAGGILKKRRKLQQEYDRWLPSYEICSAEMCW